MKRLAVFLLCAGFSIPVLLRSETLHLKDGSAVKGRLVKTEGDTVYFDTTFGASIRVHKDKVAKIDFGEGAASPQGEFDASMSSTEVPGTLLVSFEKFELTSRIIMDRGGKKDEYERENAVEQSLLVNQKKVYALVDSTTDKIVRNGPETMLRNDVKPVEFKVALAPGIHQCSIVFGNPKASEYVERFDPGPLDKKLVLDGIRVNSKETTALRVGLKRKGWRVGKSELVRIVN